MQLSLSVYHLILMQTIASCYVSTLIKLDPSERGRLSYIAGYIVSKLTRSKKIKKMNAIQSCKHSYER